MDSAEQKRGRKSADELSIPVAPIAERRPSPPDELTGQERQIWKAVVSTKPADWWRPDSFPLLTAYCQHIEQSRRLARLINKFQDEWIKPDGGLERLDKLLKAKDREDRALVNLARSMRLTQQAQMQPISAGRRSNATPSVRPPWEPAE